MRRDRRSAQPTWILCALVLAIAATGAACAQGSQVSTSTGQAGGPSTGGTGGLGGGIGAAGNGGAGGVAGGGMGGTAGNGGVGGVGGAGGGMGGTGGAVVGGGGSGGCGVDEKLCFNICVPVADPKFGCDDPECAPCADTNATPACVGGVCSILKCDAGWADCDASASTGCEVNLPTDPQNCGACGAACVVPHATPGCEESMCTIGACDAPWSDCDGDVLNGCETDVQVDAANCGACGAACAPGEQCQGGVCGVYCPDGKANCDGDALNGCEVDLGTIDDCAFCGDACQLASSTADCQAGACVVVKCDDGFEDCDGVAANGCEVNLETSAADCGACDQACPSGPNSTAVCTAGACGLVCAGGFEDCNGDPTDGCEQPTQTDPSNCGGCNNVCVTPNATPGCAAGVCKIATCNPGFADCDLAVADGCEVNLGSDPAHCGTCGTACATPANASPTCAGGTCGFTCNAGFADCDGNAANGCEVDLQTDAAHCGSCPNACNLPNATPACAAGTCAVAMCTAGFADCDGQAANGCEINLGTNVANCGACGSACNLPNTSQTCSGGVCVVGVCNAPFADCDGQAANGCETNTDSSVANCGACNQPCMVPNGSPACAAGQCLVNMCDAGHANCNNQAADGCEVSTTTDTANCGACGNACNLPNAVEACISGTCLVNTCDAGFGDCDNQPANGCEVNLNTSVGNCGTCGNACNLPNAVELCIGGNCLVNTCNAGFGDCDNQPANGCEVNLNTSVGNCGTCGNTCNLANSTEACNNGACAISTCDAGFGNCDGQTANGCETNLNTNVGNCGTCGNACNLPNSTEACNNGACAISTCNAGFGDCDGQAANGCEVNLNLSVGNCGTCGNACDLANATEACTNGACAVSTCNAGFGNCDNQPANGCEVNLNSSVGNCGACGNACNLPNSTEACNNGACAISTCDAGFGNCDNQTANGCEINLNTNVSNCGACGNACNLPNATEACTNGSCAVASCDAPFADCDGQAPNGCETNLSTSVTSCGACGNACNLPNAVPACFAGACVIGTCLPGFADCDGNAANGCEVDITTSAGNCGACGNACNLAHSTEACVASTCQVASCDAGYANCDGLAANGCEINTNTNVGNCGACGQICAPANAAGVCSGGACTIGSCNAGFENCNGSQGDGCEINLQADVQNCGSCGNNCAVQCAGNTSLTACNSGACQIQSCQAGYYNIDGMCSGGCECQASGVSQSCNTPASLGTINIGQTITTSANLVPSGVEAWYTVTFTGNTNASYHPHVKLTTNPGSAFQFDIRKDCAGGTLSCGAEGGVSNGVTDWETYNGAGSAGYYNPIPPVGNNGTILIHVFRKSGSPLTCDSYTLTVSN